MIFIINLTYVNKSIAKSIYDSDIIIEQLDLDNNYNDINNKIQFLNDVLNILHMKNDFKSFDEFIKYVRGFYNRRIYVFHTCNGILHIIFGAGFSRPYCRGLGAYGRRRFCDSCARRR